MLNKKFEWIIEVVTKRTLLPENARGKKRGKKRGRKRGKERRSSKRRMRGNEREERERGKLRNVIIARGG